MPNRIREYRLARGLTMAQLADQVGTTGPTIDKLEKGHRQLREKWLRLLAVALDCQPGDLLASDGGPPKPPFPSSYTAEFGLRLQQLSDLLGGTAKAAAYAGIGEATLERCLEGTLDIPVMILERLAAAAQVRLDWLTSGLGPRHRLKSIEREPNGSLLLDGRPVEILDEALLRHAISDAEHAAIERGYKFLTPVQHCEIILIAYRTLEEHLAAGDAAPYDLSNVVDLTLAGR